jgi:transcriptional regulator with XRE-family HTH domain
MSISKVNIQGIVGQRIRDQRVAKGMTLQQLADITGLSKPLLSKIENGKVASPISTLSQIANALNLRLSDLMADQEPVEEPPKYVLIRNGDDKGEKIPYLGVFSKALAKEIPDKLMNPSILSTFQTDLSFAGRQIVLFSHPGQEYLYVLEGEMDYVYGSERFKMKAGDSLYMDSSVPHGGVMVGKKPLKVLVVICEG